MNIYFYIALLLLTFNTMLYTYTVLKNKEQHYKFELITGIIAYMIYAILMFKMSV